MNNLGRSEWIKHCSGPSFFKSYSEVLSLCFIQYQRGALVAVDARLVRHQHIIFLLPDFGLLPCYSMLAVGTRQMPQLSEAEGAPWASASKNGEVAYTAMPFFC